MKAQGTAFVAPNKPKKPSLLCCCIGWFFAYLRVVWLLKRKIRERKTFCRWCRAGLFPWFPAPVV